MAKKGHAQRKQRFIKTNQQIRFAFDLALMALLLPVFMMAVPMIPPFSSLLIGVEAETLRGLFWDLIRFNLVNWWVPLSALVLLGFVSVRLSHRVFGPIYRFEQSLLRKKGDPTEWVSFKLRTGDYFQEFSVLLEEAINELPRGEQRDNRSNRRNEEEAIDTPPQDSRASES